jgi:hypothetical protein
MLLPFALVFLGLLVNLLDMPIYQVFEGRRFWPDWLRSRLIDRQSTRLRRLQSEIARYRSLGRHDLATEVEILTTDFPLTSDGGRVAKYPTRLGNIITEYEEYPTRKYEADGVFYWSRVWWKMPKEVRDSLDDMQAMVDGALYLSALLYLIAPLCILYAIIDTYLAPDLIRAVSGLRLVLLAALSVTAGYAFYRLSLPAHRQFGEQVKAMFDCFLAEVNVQPVIDVIARKTGEYRVKGESPSVAYRIAWRYLRWHRFRPYDATDNVNIEQIRRGP